MITDKLSADRRAHVAPGRRFSKRDHLIAQTYFRALQLPYRLPWPAVTTPVRGEDKLREDQARPGPPLAELARPARDSDPAVLPDDRNLPWRFSREHVLSASWVKSSPRVSFRELRMRSADVHGYKSAAKNRPQCHNNE